MSVTVVRVENERASISARTILKIVAIVNAAVAAQALVEFRGTVVGERRVVGARRSTGDALHLHPRRAVCPQRKVR